jgi:putative endonuclease
VSSLRGVGDQSDHRQGVGRRGEELAARHLQQAGLVVIDRNVRLPWGEIDLVAREGDELVFVEVKTRIGDASTAPDEVVNLAKLQRLERLAEAYVERLGDPDVAWRVDVVAVVLGREGRVVRVDHLTGAFLET